MKTVIIDEKLCTKIEALQYEVESRKDIIVQTLAGMVSVSGDLFKQYQDEYKDYYIQYNKAKQEMLDTYGVSGNVIWNLDFRTRELAVTEG